MSSRDRKTTLENHPLLLHASATKNPAIRPIATLIHSNNKEQPSVDTCCLLWQVAATEL